MKPLYPALALFLVLLALVILTAMYSPSGLGKTVNTGWQPLPPPGPKGPVTARYGKGDIAP